MSKTCRAAPRRAPLDGRDAPSRTYGRSAEMTLVLRYSARSDRGLVRQNNQDAVYAGPRLLALADGMGGHAAGEVASSLVIAALAPLDEDDPGRRPARASCATPPSRATPPSPGTSPTPPTSRAWAPRSPRSCSPAPGSASSTSAIRAPTSCATAPCSQITKDDTFVQSLIDEGRITEEEAHAHPAALAAAARHHRPGHRPVAHDARGAAGRPLPALLGRPVRRGQRRDARRDARRPTATRASAPTA